MTSRRDPTEAPVRTVRLEEDADVFVAQREVRDVARSEGMAVLAAEELVTAASEVARNALVHARRGELDVFVTRAGGRHGLVVVTRDDGPGIADTREALTDGFTTGSGLGLGLSSAQRMTDELELTSQAGRGTRVALTKWVK